MHWTKWVCLALSIATANAGMAQTDSSKFNKQIARDFYDNLWFSNNTDRYADYVADFYTVHDIGERKNIVEPAVEQKNIADFFWNHGVLSGSIDYQIAQGDIVATRWVSVFEPESFFGRIILGRTELPIINVLRIQDGKIVEFWNHRHDIDTPQTLRFVFKGFLYGLAFSLVPIWYAFGLRRRLKLAVAGSAAL